MEKLPFSEEYKNGWYYRTFNGTLTEEDLKWHYDEEDRIIEVVGKTDWQFQFDNKLPETINNQIFVQKGEYHRLIKGTGPLTVKIKKIT